MTRLQTLSLTLVTIAALTACKRNPPEGPMPMPTPPSTTGAGTTTTPTTTARVPEQPPVPPPITDPGGITSSDPLMTSDIDVINKNSPLKPVFFAYDSDSLDDAGRKIIADNAEILKKYSSWVITVEGHCDERGTAEYNLALGDRRALAVKNYLVTLGIPAERIKTVSYGNEFPFNPGKDEQAWKDNRRAHFMLTSR
jgi:peptidoglycan-associated lipoprotein